MPQHHAGQAELAGVCGTRRCRNDQRRANKTADIRHALSEKTMQQFQTLTANKSQRRRPLPVVVDTAIYTTTPRQLRNRPGPLSHLFVRRANQHTCAVRTLGPSRAVWRLRPAVERRGVRSYGALDEAAEEPIQCVREGDTFEVCDCETSAAGADGAVAAV